MNLLTSLSNVDQQKQIEESMKVGASPAPFPNDKVPFACVVCSNEFYEGPYYCKHPISLVIVLYMQ